MKHRREATVTFFLDITVEPIDLATNSKMVALVHLKLGAVRYDRRSVSRIPQPYKLIR